MRRQEGCFNSTILAMVALERLGESHGLLHVRSVWRPVRGEQCAAGSCPICSDPRQYIRLAGQAWTTLEELSRDHKVVLKDEDGVLSIGVEPVFGIGQRALLAETPDGNVLWDCVPLVTDEAVAALNARGKVRAIAISHPHFHSAIVEWSRALGGIPIYIHAGNRDWVMRPDPAIVFWEEETKIDPSGCDADPLRRSFRRVLGMPLEAQGQTKRCPGRRYIAGRDGQEACQLHVLLSKSLAAQCPCHQSHRARHWQPFEYEQVYSAFWNMRILEDGKEAVARSVERYLKAIAD